MAKVSFYKLTNDNLNSLSIKEGQVIFITDTKRLYLDDATNSRIEIASYNLTQDASDNHILTFTRPDGTNSSYTIPDHIYTAENHIVIDENNVITLDDETQNLLYGDETYTVNGDNLYIENNNGELAKRFQLDGRTEQETTTGKNLLNFSLPYIVSGEQNKFLPTLPLTETGENYYFVGWCDDGTTLNVSNCVAVWYNSNTSTTIKNENFNVTFQASDLSNADSFYLYLAPSLVGKTIVSCMLIKGTYDSLNVPDYEPYTGGMASPNPDYPQEIENITGDIEIKVENKNLFNPANFITRNKVSITNDGVISSKGIDSTAWNYNNRNWAGVLPAGTYRLSIFFSTLDTDSYPSVRVYSSSGDLLINFHSLNNIQHLSKTITLAEETTIGIMFKLSNGVCTFQLEKGLTATDYVPHQEQVYSINLGNNELCRIGNYKDKLIYDSLNERLYIEKNIGKIASYNGETITTDYISTTGGLDTGATIYYVLDNPQYIDLTPYVDIRLSKGINNISNSEDTNMELEYYNKSIDGMYNELSTRINNIDYIDISEKGSPSGVAELNENGILLTSQMPSYVDDVLEYTNLAAFPAAGESGKIYVALDTNKTYRWSGSAYTEISASLALGETSSTAYRGDRGAAAYTHAVTNKGSAFMNGMYKFTTNNEGHVTEASTIQKSDIVNLGIPGSADQGIKIENNVIKMEDEPYHLLYDDAETSIEGTNIHIEDALENKVYNLELEKESTQETTPSPDYPQDVKTVTGYENLFEIKEPEYSGQNAWSSYGGTNYIKNENGYTLPYRYGGIGFQYNNLIVGKVYTLYFDVISNIQSSVGVGVNVYSGHTEDNSSSKTYSVSTTKQRIYFTFIAATNNRISFNSGSTDSIELTISNIQLTEGTEELPYVPYGNNYVDVKVVGKNLFTGLISGYLFSSGNVTIPRAGYVITDKIYLKPNTTYTLSNLTTSQEQAGNGYKHIVEYDENNNGLGEIYCGNYSTATKTFTTKSNTKYIRYGIYSSFASTELANAYINSNNIQLEQGSTATSYEPYQELIVPIPLNGNEIAGIGDYKDELIVDSKGHCYINKKVGKVVLNGTESIRKASATDIDRFIWDIPEQQRLWLVDTNSLSNYFTYNVGNVVGCFRNNAGTQLVFNFTSGGTTTLEQFKEWLSTHNVILYQPLATPELIDLDYAVDLTLFNGVNNISNSDDMDISLVYLNNSINGRYQQFLDITGLIIDGLDEINGEEV